jgi:hypothetical protein
MSANGSSVQSEGAAWGEGTGEAARLAMQLAALEARLTSQERQLLAHQERLLAQDSQLAQQTQELVELRRLAARATVEAAGWATWAAEQTPIRPGSDAQPRPSRRSVLSHTAAALTTLGLTGAAQGGSIAHAKPEGATGDPLKIGQTNQATAASDVTRLQSPSAGPANVLFQADNAPTPTVLPTTRQISIAGTNSFPPPTAVPGAPEPIGVYGKATNGFGVVADGLLPLRIVPGSGAPEPALPFDAGGSFFLSSGALRLLYGNTPLIEAIWRRLADTTQTGVVRLITPTRVVDTRATAPGIVTTGYDAVTGAPITAGPIPAGTVRRFRITGKSFPQGGSGSFSFPTDVSGILCDVTVIGAGGGGYVTVFSGNVPDAEKPLASTVNPSTPIAHNFTAVAVLPDASAAFGLITGGLGSIAVFSTNTTDVAIDAVGIFLF